MLRSLVLTAAVALVPLAAPTSAAAWGATGHRLIGQAAAEALPAELPEFLRTPAAAASIGELARELDISKGSGKVHDEMRDPSHFIDLDDEGRAMGGPSITAMPTTRNAYAEALRAANSDLVKAGWLFYAIVDEQQQLTKDFGYWRAMVAAERRALEDTADPRRSAERRAWLAEERRRREALIFANIGPLAHHVGDATQPLHLSIHYNGWGDFPNPEGFSTAKVHGPIEGAFTRSVAKLDQVKAAMPAPQTLSGAPEAQVAAYLQAQHKQVIPLYRLEKAGGFQPGDPRGAAFVHTQLGAAAGQLRDVIAAAWAASAQVQIGYPQVNVADIESGKVDPFDALYGVD